MLTLRVWLENGETQDLILDPGNEYKIGRSETSDVVLGKSSISRLHARVFEIDGQWQLEISSRYGAIEINGQKEPFILLEPQQRFSIEDFQFEVLESSPDNDGHGFQEEDALSDEPTQSRENLSSEKEEPEEKTAILATMTTPTIRITAHQDATPVLLKLHGEKWTVGRGGQADIRINDSRSSRQHVLIERKQNGLFQVTDLGSSNGTRLNGMPLPANGPKPLQSGDTVQIGQTTLYFEVRDPHFDGLVSQAPVEYQHPSHPIAQERIIHEKGGRKRFDLPKMTPIRIALVALTLVLIFAILSQDDKSGPQPNGNNLAESSGKLPGPQVDPLSRLTPEQKILLEDTFNLANSLYMQGKYESAIIELRKIHKLVPEYRDSKKLLLYSEEGVERRAQKEEIARRKREEAELKERVARMVTNCENKYAGNLNLPDIEQCLAPVFDLDPENNDAKRLVSRAADADAEKARSLAQKRRTEGRLEAARQLLRSAHDAKERKDWKSALDSYEKYLNGDYPNKDLERTRAQISSLKSMIANEVAQKLSAANEADSKGDLKTAYENVLAALKFDPKNSEALKTEKKISRKLFKKIKDLYGDSILEEDLGNIESAKQKWRTIMDFQGAAGDYREKAKIKLQKYGELKRGEE